MTDDETPETPPEPTPPEPEKSRRKRVSGVDILDAIKDLGEKITTHTPSGDEDPGDDEASGSSSPLPPVVTFAPEEEPTPTPIATDAEASAPIPPVATPGRRKGFPHRGRRGR